MLSRWSDTALGWLFVAGGFLMLFGAASFAFMVVQFLSHRTCW